MSKTRQAYVDYQQRASEFSVGDYVYPFVTGQHNYAGRVLAVWPAIGMVDVQWPHGTERRSVEELQRTKKKDNLLPSAEQGEVPGGSASVSVSGGPAPRTATVEAWAQRVAEAFVKKSLYWGGRNRKYRATKAEIESGKFGCPKCRADGILLKRVNYKREEGHSDHLLGCPSCLFVIKRCDLIGHPEYVEPECEEEAI